MLIFNDEVLFSFVLLTRVLLGRVASASGVAPPPNALRPTGVPGGLLSVLWPVAVNGGTGRVFGILDALTTRLLFSL